MKKLIGCFIAMCTHVAVFAYDIPGISYYIYDDEVRGLNAQQALQLFINNKYQPLETNEFNPGFTQSVYWLAVKIDSSVNADSLRLMVGHPTINVLDFYVADGADCKLLYKTGDHLPYSSRPLPTADYSFPLSNKYHIYILRVDKHNESLQLRFQIVNLSSYVAAETENNLITGILTGIIILLAIFGCYLSVMTRQRIYILYVLYIVSGWLWVLSDLGFGFKYLWPNNTWFASRSRPLFVDLTIALSLQYLIYYLSVIKSKLLRKILNITSYIAFFFVCLWLLPIDIKTSNQLSWILLISLPVTAAAYIVITLITLYAEFRRSNIMALFYFTALAPLMLLTFVFILNHGGVINISGTVIELYGIPFGYVIEAIILTFGLAYRFNTYRLEKERIQVAFERQQKENAKALIETEAKERRRIADELHDVAGSMLSAAKLNITSVRETDLLSEATSLKLKKAEEALSFVAGSVRNLSHALSPVTMHKIGFKRTIENVASFFNTSGKINIEVITIGFDEYQPRLQNIYTVLYSITYEFLNNIIKHSKASHAIVQIIEHESSITLIVEDNGIGLKAEFDKQNTKGLSGIISKINYFNGSIEFDNTGEGLIVSIEIPKGIYETEDSVSG